MAVIDYDPEGTMREARARYFAVNAFGDDGGYGDTWVDFKFGPVPMPIPNTASRVKAVRFHDLHHIVTGYDTDTAGEFEISAWEIGAGCRDFWAAWVLNLSGMVAGIPWMPRKTFRAFVRGLRSRSLYGLELDPLLDERVKDVRARLTADTTSLHPTAGDYAKFVLASVLGLAVGLAFLVIALPLMPVGFVALNLAARRRAAA